MCETERQTDGAGEGRGEKRENANHGSHLEAMRHKGAGPLLLTVGSKDPTPCEAWEQVPSFPSCGGPLLAFFLRI